MKQHTNGNYFQTWLEQYKMRLEQAKLNNAEHADAQCEGGVYAATTNEAPAHPPAPAGDLSAFFLPSNNLRSAFSK